MTTEILIFKHPNGDEDKSGCEPHAWQVPCEDGHIGPHSERYTLIDALMAWCAKCGSMAWGKGRNKTLIVPTFRYGSSAMKKNVEQRARNIASEIILEKAKELWASGLSSHDFNAGVLRKIAIDLKIEANNDK